MSSAMDTSYGKALGPLGTQVLEFLVRFLESLTHALNSDSSTYYRLGQYRLYFSNFLREVKNIKNSMMVIIMFLQIKILFMTMPQMIYE